MKKRLLWKKIKQRGPILWDNTIGQMRGAQWLFDTNGEKAEFMPSTYMFKGVPPYDSISALIPVGNKKDPFSFIYYQFDEDEGQPEGWVGRTVLHPLSWQTEDEYLEKEKQQLNSGRLAE